MPGKLIQKAPADDVPKNGDKATTMAESETILAQKAAREFEYDRKLTLNSARRKTKNTSDPKIRICRPKNPYVRAAPKGGRKIRLDGGEDEEVIETDWVATVDSRPELREVPLTELLKPGKVRHHGYKAGDFEVVPNMPSVIILDEHSASEPEYDEPWEHLDFDDDDQGARASHRTLSYAEIAASTT